MSIGALSVVAGGRAPRGWEWLWELDAWPFTELPNADPDSEQHGTIRFDRIGQRWLREAAKRWARAQLLASTTPDTMRAYLRDLSVFSEWMVERTPEVCSPALINRALLEDYLLWVRTGDRAASTRRRYLCVLRRFLAEQCEDGLVGLPAGAVIHRSEMPKLGDRPPRGLDRAVFDQFIDPANLALLGNEQQRTVILLLAHTGLRVSSVVTLARDAVEIESDGHPYLRYRNVKLKREAMLPIGPVLADQIRVQQRSLDDAYGTDGTRFLLPSPPEGHVGWSPGRGGDRHIAKETVNQIVAKYVRRAEIRGSDGKLATGVHPHLFRHHLGTSLVNDGVALPVIQRVLDHESTEMTARYAHVADETVSTALAGWHERVNIRGERIALPIDGPLAEAAWMKDRISRAKQALPNGYCGLPLVQSCPHPNACLSCDHFLTDLSYRQVHEDQLAQTRRLRSDAEDGAQIRLVELLAGDEAALARIPHRPGRTRSRRLAGRPADRSDRDRAGAIVTVERSDAVGAAAANRSTDTTARARLALRELEKRGREVNFAAVAAAANVSRQFLYTHDELREEIEQLRGEQRSALSQRPVAERASDESIRVRLRAALDDNHRLRGENTRLRDELALAHGSVRELELSRRTGRSSR